jgi:hypothetical protein
MKNYFSNFTEDLCFSQNGSFLYFGAGVLIVAVFYMLVTCS